MNMTRKPPIRNKQRVEDEGDLLADAGGDHLGHRLGRLIASLLPEGRAGDEERARQEQAEPGHIRGRTPARTEKGRGAGATARKDSGHLPC
jgi:hypothetical protein